MNDEMPEFETTDEQQVLAGVLDFVENLNNLIRITHQLEAASYEEITPEAWTEIQEIMPSIRQIAELNLLGMKNSEEILAVEGVQDLGTRLAQQFIEESNT